MRQLSLTTTSRLNYTRPALPPRQWISFLNRNSSFLKKNCPQPAAVDGAADNFMVRLHHLQQHTFDLYCYRPDVDEDIWEYPEKYGDCEDYCIFMLVNTPTYNLKPHCSRLLICRTPAGIGHMMFGYETVNSTYIIDSTSDMIAQPHERILHDYRFIKAYIPGQWWWRKIEGWSYT